MTQWPFLSVVNAEREDQNQIEKTGETAERVPHERLLTSLAPRHCRRDRTRTSSDLDYRRE